ncbi:MAG: hypothetical protein QF444_00500, partial [Phycisphaerales bacterium]|nr:hypothetical protein [Phycisphaerales bacterium]
FPGAILLITHDRFMLDRIATEYLALDGCGTVKEFAGFEQWQEWRLNKRVSQIQEEPSKAKERVKSAPVKLSYKLQREFDTMEDAIAKAEAEVERSEAIANDESVMADHQKHSKACTAVAQAHERVRKLYERWAELEEML